MIIMLNSKFLDYKQNHQTKIITLSNSLMQIQHTNRKTLINYLVSIQRSTTGTQLHQLYLQMYMHMSTAMLSYHRKLSSVNLEQE